MTLLGAITAARSSVTIVTPYFLPDSGADRAGIKRGRDARRGGQYPAAGSEQPTIGAVGLDGAAWQVLEDGRRGVANAAAVRPHKADGGGQGLGAARLTNSLEQWLRDDRLRNVRPLTLGDVDPSDQATRRPGTVTIAVSLSLDLNSLEGRSIRRDGVGLLGARHRCGRMDPSASEVAAAKEVNFVLPKTSSGF